MLKVDIYKENFSLELFDVNGVIGIFERILVFIFACSNSFFAIAIILGIKIFIRINDFKDDNLQNKDVLDTFVSIVIAILISIVCQYL